MTKPDLAQSLDPAELERIVQSEHWDPFQVLGMHEVTTEEGTVVVHRAFLRDAKELALVDTADPSNTFPAEPLHPHGLFQAVIPDRHEWFPYRLRITDFRGAVREVEDVYRFLPLISDQDLYLFNEGTHRRLWEMLGAHVTTVDGVSGVHFAVWAPNGKRVSVVGDFNEWDGRWHPMRVRGQSGVWELFVPDLDDGALYKYEIKTRRGALLLKNDPYGFGTEYRPRTASVVRNLSRYQWTDDEWMLRRRESNPLTAPLSIYEVHLGSWRRVPEEGSRPLTYRELAETLVPYVKSLGFTHIELLPVAEHPLDESWGYQVTNYYSVTSRYGSPEDFMALVDACHQNGIGVIMDWVPAHFPRDEHGLARFDGTQLYNHRDPRQGAHPDWGTLIFNYGRNEVRNFLTANALFWLEKLHVDGLRVDAVASMLYLDYSREQGQWVPNRFGGRENLDAIRFLQEVNALVHDRFPGALMMAEESTSWPQVSRPTYLGGLGFTFKWNMGWMHDTLRYFSKDPIHRKYHQNNLTFGLLYAFHENFVLPLSHDEVVHGKRSLLDKMPGDYWQKFANLRLLLACMFGHPGKKLLFMGGEFGQWKEWSESTSLDWLLLDFDSHRGVQRLVADLNHVYRSQPALYEADFEPGGFEWIDFRDTDNVTVSFLRRATDRSDSVIFVFNMTPVPRFGYRIGVPAGGWFAELLNTDATQYGGSGLGNLGGVQADAIPWQGYSHSLALTLPPLAGLVLKLQAA